MGKYGLSSVLPLRQDICTTIRTREYKLYIEQILHGLECNIEIYCTNRIALNEAKPSAISTLQVRLCTNGHVNDVLYHHSCPNIVQTQIQTEIELGLQRPSDLF